MSFNKEEALKYHSQGRKGKIEVVPTKPCFTARDLSLAYTPGVAEPCREIEKNDDDVYKYTAKGNLVAVVSNGTAVLGLGDIGPHAGKPVMEGKGVLFKRFADIDVFDIELKTHDPKEVIRTVQLLEPTFGGINLEDIKAPECFEIEEELIKTMNIPVFHDDQHGTAIVVLAGVINALKVVGKKIYEVKVVINGAGAAGTAIAKLLMDGGVKNVIMVDSKGIISKERADLKDEKIYLASVTNQENISGSLKEAVVDADVFVGVSKPGILTEAMIKTMNSKAIIFAMANPTPEIMPDLAKKAGAAVVATGRSDFPNQVNNVLVFPGIFRGLLDGRIRKVTTKMKLAAAIALADLIKKPHSEEILPSPLDKSVAKKIAEAISNTKP